MLSCQSSVIINRFRSVIVAILLLLPLISTVHAAQERVVNGSSISSSGVPWMVVLELAAYIDDGYYLVRCGGTIIDSNRVLTAAHCTEGVNLSWSKVLEGASYFDGNNFTYSRAHNIRYLSSHSGYNGYSDNDLAVVIIDDSFDSAPVTLNRYTGSESLSALKVFGWGEINAKAVGSQASGSSPSQLQVGDLSYVTQSDCNQRLSPHLSSGETIGSQVICAVGENDDGAVDACQGDSGGPLIQYQGSQAYLVGVVSAGFGCAQYNSDNTLPLPGLYTDVISHVSWIDNQTGPSSSGGCSMSGGRFDPTLWLLMLVSAALLWRKSHKRKKLAP